MVIGYLDHMLLFARSPIRSGIVPDLIGDVILLGDRIGKQFRSNSIDVLIWYIALKQINIAYPDIRYSFYAEIERIFLHTLAAAVNITRACIYSNSSDHVDPLYGNI
jgi:hypothetical protein